MSVEEKKSISNRKKIKKKFFLVYYQMTLNQYNTAYALEILFVNKATLYFNSYERILILTNIFLEKNFLKKVCKNILKISNNFAYKSQNIKKIFKKLS